MIKPGKYKHYSGKEYQVLGVARHSETLEFMVIYKPLYDAPEDMKLWARPLKIFEEDVEIEGTKKKRFEFIDDSE